MNSITLLSWNTAKDPKGAGAGGAQIKNGSLPDPVSDNVFVPRSERPLIRAFAWAFPFNARGHQWPVDKHEEILWNRNSTAGQQNTFMQNWHLHNDNIMVGNSQYALVCLPAKKEANTWWESRDIVWALDSLSAIQGLSRAESVRTKRHFSICCPHHQCTASTQQFSNP